MIKRFSLKNPKKKKSGMMTLNQFLLKNNLKNQNEVMLKSLMKYLNKKQTINRMSKFKIHQCEIAEEDNHSEEMDQTDKY